MGHNFRLSLLAGLMNHSRVTSEDWEGRFRCFAYQGIFDGFHLSQSGEATCNLYSAREGDRTMTLKKGRDSETSTGESLIFLTNCEH